MSLVIENVYDDLVDPAYNGEFVSYHLEGMCLVATDHMDKDARYLVEIRVHPLDKEDWDEGPIIIDTGAGFGKMVINGKPRDRKSVRDEQESEVAKVKSPALKKSLREFFSNLNELNRKYTRGK